MADSRPNQSENQPAEMEPDTIVEEEEEEPVNTNEFHNPIHNLANIPKLGQDDTITYRDHDTGTLITARVVGRAGKATGKYGNWYNLDFLQPDGVNKRQSVDLSQVDDLRVSGTSSNISDVQEENVMVLEDISMDNAKTAELDSWKQNEVYKEVEDKGQKCISTRWVCTLKQTKDGIRPKARLVARGFEEINNKQIPKDSPTCGKESLRLIIAIIAHNRWRPRSMDIKTAFLQGQKIQRDIFIRPPKEAGCSGKVWHLQKCVYGLGDASLYWYNKVKSVMVQFGAKTSQVDPAVYYWVNDSGDVIGILASHVDDFIWGGTAEFETTVISRIRSEFSIGKEDSHTFQYVGIDLVNEDEQIYIHQNDYADRLTPIQLSRERAMERNSQLTTSEVDLLRSKVGQLLWIAHQSRPDILFDACNLAASINNGKVQDILDANKVIRRLKSDGIPLKFQHLGDGKLSLVVFSDASLGNLPDGGSQGGHLVFLVGETGKFSLINWNSKKLRRVVRSTLAGETLAMADGIDEAIFISTLYSELTSGKPDTNMLPLVCITDCKSLYEAVKSTKLVTEKRLRIEISGIKELIDSRQVKKFLWSESKKQLADCLTKKGASPLMLMKILEEGILNI